MSDTRETIRFSDRVSAGESVTLTKTMREAATVEQVDVRFYSGPDLTVEVEPYAAVGDEGDRERQSLVELVGRQAVVGDGDKFTFYASQPVERDDLLGVAINNNSDEVDDDGDGFDYDVIVDVVVDHAGGSSRIGLDLFDGGLF